MDIELMNQVMAAGEQLNHYYDLTIPQQKEIFIFLTQACEQANRKAFRHLARCYEHGIGCEKDLNKALDLYHKAAEKDTSARYYLGYFYGYGPEELRNHEKSQYYLNLAFSSDNKNAIHSGRILWQQSDYFTIDFSCKHDILLKNEDGSYLPMDEPWFENEKIKENVWLVRSGGDFSYVITSGKEGIAIDCGYGAGNIRKYMSEISGVDVKCVCNTHDHFDHTANNAYFNHAYMSETTAKYATIPFQSFDGIDFFGDTVDKIIVKDGDIIPFGDKELYVMIIADHAPGSAFYLDKKDRILFLGDEIFPEGCKQLSGSLKNWVSGMEKIQEHWDEFDLIYGGGGKIEKEVVWELIQASIYAYEHQGEAQAEEKGKRGKREPEYHDGHLVYPRFSPHPGDSADGNYDKEDYDKPKQYKIIHYHQLWVAFGK